jgi:hypothetical protein
MTIAIKSPSARFRFHQSGISVPGAIALKKLWWHIRAYVPIMGILFLILGSLIFLQIHWLYQNLSNAFKQESRFG